MTTSSTPDDDGDVHFGYFVLQAKVAHDRLRAGIRVIVENLGTGEKRECASTRELGRYLEEWGTRALGNARASPGER